VSVLQPVFTRRTIVSRINEERMAANAIEAAEQSGRLSVPDIREAVSLDKLLASWPEERRLLFCDEGGDAKAMTQAAREAGAGRAPFSPAPKAASIPPSAPPACLAVRDASDAGAAHPARRHRRPGGAGRVAVNCRRLGLALRFASTRDRQNTARRQPFRKARP